MKRESKHKYKVSVPVTAPAAVSAKIPTYRGSGRVQEFKRILPPLRDKTIIDMGILSGVIIEMSLELDLNRLSLHNGICEVNKLKFRYKDLFDLIRTLRNELIINCSDQTLRIVEFRYNARFQTAKRKIRKK